MEVSKNLKKLKREESKNDVKQIVNAASSFKLIEYVRPVVN